MLYSIRKSKFSRFLWAWLALYLVNLSIDLPDFNLHLQNSDIRYNEQESVIEMVVEKCLGFENAISEQDERETEEHNSNQQPKKDFSPVFKILQELKYVNVSLTIREKSLPGYFVYWNTRLPDPESPPPKYMFL